MATNEPELFEKMDPKWTRIFFSNGPKHDYKADQIGVVNGLYITQEGGSTWVKTWS